jgi:hypothetical protein
MVNECLLWTQAQAWGCQRTVCVGGTVGVVNVCVKMHATAWFG